jgi:hypothetical protein
MRNIKITYWISTCIISAMVFFSGYNYLTREEVKQACQHLGFPDYFRIELSFAKFSAALALLIPVGSILKEWAYFGCIIIFISAPIAHLSSHDPAAHSFGSIGYLLILIVSYVSYRKYFRSANVRELLF